MRKLFIALTALISLQLTAQVEDPTDWKTSVEKISDSEFLLITEASIEPGWHVYSQAKGEKDEGPIATEFNFFGTEGFELQGINKEKDPYAEYVEIWGMDVYQFANYARFEQKVTLKDTSLKYIAAEVYFMVCDDTQCLPPSPESLIFKLDKSVDVVPDDIINAFYDAGAEPVKAQAPPASSIKKKGDKHEKKDDENGMQDPTEWSTSVKKISDTEYVLITDVSIESGWHLYSQAKGEKDEGPIATEFNFFGTEDYDLVGINEEKGSYADYEKVWEMDVYHFGNQAHFEQKVSINNPDLKYIAAEAYFMVCDDTQCLPPSPESLIFKFDKSVDVVPDDIINAFYDAGAEPVKAQAPPASSIKKKGDKHEKKDDEEEEDEEEKSLWGIFLGCLVAGILTLATPCVFPMIPMTVSFFTKQAGGKLQGVLYGVFILLIYVLFSLPFHLFESVSPDVFNEFSTNPWLNIFFFIVFVIFAISFFGAFEITMPNSLINKVDKASNVGGLIGVFFMALTLVLVSFSCTGPVIGAVLGSVLSTDGGATALSAGMAGFGFGLGIPFALFAIFPSWMNSLPKSGGWLNTVKVFLGFLELAFAFKFLSNADLVMQWHLVEREVFVAIWVAVFGALALYLFGKIKLPHDGPDQNISVGRMLLGLTSLVFSLYLLPGIWGAPLKIISGFPPPSTYSESPYGVGYKKQSSGATATIELPEHAHYAVHDIIAFNDYEEGLAYAKKVKKPVLIDFTGWACVNCRKMEERVWAEPQILNILKNDVVLVSLYVDEKKALPKDQQYTSEATQKRIRSVGNKWSDLQITRYQVNAQPYYALVDENGEDLEGVEQIGYTPDVDEYEAWLSNGIKKYE